MEQTFTVATPADFAVVITAILDRVASDTIVLALSGDLGAGKTTFTQILARLLGVTEPVTSPTFTIMKQYPLEHERFDVLVHIDAYRIEDESEAAPLRLGEVLGAPRTITCLEWPDQIAAVVPPDAVQVHIAITEGETRTVQVQFPE